MQKKLNYLVIKYLLRDYYMPNYIKASEIGKWKDTVSFLKVFIVFEGDWDAETGNYNVV